ncbi:hypothetical protein PIB30_108251 [Stylosanthes scabra]|uniref:Uncharacterized protein n=1 Tax=Stylosanthes scabra TaxID=79078 RepID=A0ABU6TYU7_9FABA|nr:hypothetical protein [Stylosanthes scabra]
MNMDMLVTIVRVPLLVMPWIGCEFLGLRTRNNHICGRTFGSTPKTPIPPPVQPTGFKPKEPKPRPRSPWKPEFREFFPGDSSGTQKGEKEEKASDRTINFIAQNDGTSEEDSSTDYSEETSEVMVDEFLLLPIIPIIPSL